MRDQTTLYRQTLFHSTDCGGTASRYRGERHEYATNVLVDDRQYSRYRFEPRPETDAHPDQPDGSYHVRLAPDLTVADIDPRLAEVLGVDRHRCEGEFIADLMQGLTATAHLHLTTKPVRDASGILVGIQLEVTPRKSLLAD